MIELGPYLLSDESFVAYEYEKTGIPQLLYNPNGWQKVANIIALSMPPPIGYSFCYPIGPSASGNDCGPWNDTSSASVSYHAMKNFYKKYPELKKNKLFLAGESYAGVYVPQIVKEIMADTEEKLNLEGFAVGDACTPPAVCGSNQVGPFYALEFLYGKSAFSNSLYDSITAICTKDELMHGGSISTDCQNEINKVPAEVGGYWIYSFYDECYYENDIRRRSLESLLDPSRASSYDRKYYGPPISSRNKNKLSFAAASINPRVVNVPNGYYCGGPAAEVEWLESSEVKKALHIPDDAVFFQSDDGVGFTYYYTESDLISWYQEVINEGKLRILIYNGDTDPCINAFQSQNWTEHIGSPIVQGWRPWTTDGCQRMGGYVIRYENNFDFLTIRGKIYLNNNS